MEYTPRYFRAQSVKLCIKRDLIHLYDLLSRVDGILHGKS